MRDISLTTFKKWMTVNNFFLHLAQVSKFVAVLGRQGDDIRLTMFYERATRKSFCDDATYRLVFFSSVVALRLCVYQTYSETPAWLRAVCWQPSGSRRALRRRSRRRNTKLFSLPPPPPPSQICVCTKLPHLKKQFIVLALLKFFPFRKEVGNKFLKCCLCRRWLE